MNNTPRSSSSPASAAPWIVVAALAGLIVGWFDLSGTADVQGPALLLMLAGFACALPGGASLFAIGIAAGLGVPIMHLVAGAGGFSPATLLAIIPAVVGAVGGRIAGTLLELAGTSLESGSLAPFPSGRESAPLWYRKPIETRVLLALALTAIAALGLQTVNNAVSAVSTRAPLFVALVWQISTYVAWIALTPSIVRLRSSLRGTQRGKEGVGLLEAGLHLGLLAGLVIVHAEALVVLTALLRMPMGSEGAGGLFVIAARAYFPLDALVYSAVLGIAFSSDAARYARERATREAALAAEAAEAKLESLRAQLNPHFLYNALNSIVVLANAGEQTKVVATLERLSSMLRYVLEEKRPLVLLGDELEFVRRYLEIQQIRFGERLRFALDHSSDVDRLLVPPLILQPLVENAVEHGIAETIVGGTVTVTVSRESNSLVLKVEDDGKGISPAKAAEKIGIGNTRSRLEKLFGSASSVTLAERPGGGAISVIRIPVSGTTAPGK